MLFWSFVIVLVIGIVLIAVGNISWNKDKHEFLYWHDGDMCYIGGCLAIISGIVTTAMLIVLSCIYINVDAKVEVNKERYEALEYKIESGACRDELGLLSKEVIDEVQEWNEDVVYYQNIQNNFWVGIFYPNVFDQFETIDYKKWE